MPDHSADSEPPFVTVTLPDGTTLRGFEAEVETHFEGPGYMGVDVPYIVPLDWRHGFDEHRPHSVRLFAVLPEAPEQA